MLVRESERVGDNGGAVEVESKEKGRGDKNREEENWTISIEREQNVVRF